MRTYASKDGEDEGNWNPYILPVHEIEAIHLQRRERAT
jgi:hypothetical protein